MAGKSNNQSLRKKFVLIVENNMTPLEEKIYREAEKLLNDFKNQRVNYSEAIDVIQSIATQAVEEYKKELLEKLPTKEVRVHNIFGARVPSMTDEGFNDCLTQVHNIISKPNI